MIYLRSIVDSAKCIYCLLNRTFDFVLLGNVRMDGDALILVGGDFRYLEVMSLNLPLSRISQH